MPGPGGSRGKRSVRLVRRAEPWVAEVADARGVRAQYLIRRVDSEIGGRGWSVWKLGTLQMYHVRTDPRDLSHCSCDCIAFEARRDCKHLACLLALHRRGALGTGSGVGP